MAEPYDPFWARIEAEAPDLAEVFPPDYEDIYEKEEKDMANHLKGKQCLFELDERGNLTIHTDGRHMTIPADDVAGMLRWLNTHDEVVAKEQEMQRRSTWERHQKIARDRGLLNLFGDTGDEPKNT